jgi:hypothetical protein
METKQNTTNIGLSQLQELGEWSSAGKPQPVQVGEKVGEMILSMRKREKI